MQLMVFKYIIKPCKFGIFSDIVQCKNGITLS